MKATVENLKAHRNEIINELTELFGSERLKSNMQSLLNIVESAELFEKWKTIENCIDELIDLSTESRRKTTKIADILGKLSEQELERN